MVTFQLNFTFYLIRKGDICTAVCIANKGKMKSFADVFDKVLEYCREKVSSGELTDVAYNTWIKTMVPVRLDGNIAYFSVPSEFHSNCTMKNYGRLLSEAFLAILGFEVEIRINVSDEQSAEEPTAFAENAVQSSAARYDDSDYEYTFDTFIVGRSNEFAYAACTAVAKTDHTDMTYNPLFIYGPSGMGKTHLLNAICKEIKLKFPEKNVIFVTGEAFANELIDMIAKKDTMTFKQKYRGADVLLIDDIHFIAGKDSTQEEFFHTFNDLYNKGKQIVITSDRPPKEIKTLESRIRTRFEWGIIADISAPEYETRVAIIKRKAKQMAFVIPDDVVECIANRLKSSIRQLEGCVKKLKASHDLVGTPPTIVMAQNAIREILSDEQPAPITVDRIISDVASVYGVTTDDIRSKKRSAQISTARKVCAYIIKQVLQLSYKTIGAEIGGKDHSTVVYYIDDVNTSMKNDSRTRETIEDIIKNFKA